MVSHHHIDDYRHVHRIRLLKKPKKRPVDVILMLQFCVSLRLPRQVHRKTLLLLAIQAIDNSLLLLFLLQAIFIIARPISSIEIILTNTLYRLFWLSDTYMKSSLC